MFKYNVVGNGLGFGNILETILLNRGVTSPKEFLNLNESCIEDILHFDNIELGITKLMEHINKENNILIVVDTDVDGFTSSSMLCQHINEISTHLNKKPNVEFICHNDKKHGLDEGIMSHIVTQNKYNLIILPDASSNDYKQHEVLKPCGIDILVLDHHEAEKYSENAIVVNNQLSNNVKNKTLTGVGVVYKFCKLIDNQLNIDLIDNYLDLLALGLIADSADLRNFESRYLVNQGIEFMKSDSMQKNKFITTLLNKQSYSMGGKITIIGIAFYIAPLINSLIRCGTFEDNMNLFKAFIGDVNKIVAKVRGKGEMELSIEEYMVKQCESAKRKQKKITDECVDTLQEQIDKFKLNQNPIIICNGDDVVEKNFTGLIANKIASKYHKPCLILKSYEDTFSGSGRGYDKSDITDFKKWCNDSKLFVFAEGHNNSFGVSININNINNLYEYISKIPCSDILNYNVDGVFNDKTLSPTIVEMVAKYNHIWGNSVDEPLFALEDLLIESQDIKLMGEKKNTIKFTYKGIDFILFNSNENYYNQIISNKQNTITLIGRFSINEYAGKTTPQILIVDIDFQKSEQKAKFKF